MTDEPFAKPIRVAVIGAGIFAQEAHLPALLALEKTFTIAAVFSRTRKSAAALASLAPYDVDVYDDLDALLARPDIEAVDVVLPILAMPEVIDKALAAGKHVISEKPLAPDVATGRRLLATFRQHSRQVWMIAENNRYDQAYVQAAELIRGGAIGRPLICDYPMQIAMSSALKYYRTAWRRDGTLPGGVLLDGGIHHAAVLRFLLGDVASVSAIVTQMRPDLKPVDTISSVLQFESGAIGSYTATYAAIERTNHGLLVVGDKGSLRVHSQEIELVTAGALRRIPFSFNNTAYRADTHAELAAFAASIRQGQPNRNSPEECLRDLALFEAMLRSAATRQWVTPERV